MTPAPATTPRRRRALLLGALALPLLAAGCGSGGSSTTAASATTTASGPATAQTAEVDGRDTLTFGPSVVLAKVGALSLTVRNAGQVPHDLVFDQAGLSRTGTLDGGAKQVLSLTFPQPGTYGFQCTFHPGMTGKVVVS